MEAYISVTIRKALIDVTDEEYKIFISILKKLKCFSGERNDKFFKMLSSYQQSNVPKNFDRDEDLTPFFEVYNLSNANGFSALISKQILPKLTDSFSDATRLKLLRMFCDIPPFLTKLDAEIAFPAIHFLTQNFLPSETKKQLKFDCLECILYTYHYIATKKPTQLSAIITSDLPQSDFKQRLRALKRKTEKYSSNLQKNYSYR